jgi:hypothetical protein
MSLKVNKKSLKQQGGQMIPEQPGMQQQTQQPQVDPKVMEITQVINQSVQEGQDPKDVISGLLENQVDSQMIAQALMVAGMKEEQIIALFESIEESNQPSQPDQVSNNPQLLARNESLQTQNQQGSPEEQMMPMAQSGNGETINDYWQDEDGNIERQEIPEVTVTADNRSLIKKLTDNALYQINPLYMADDALQVLGIPANFIREGVQGIFDKGDGKFDWGNIIPDIRNTTILDDDPSQEGVSKSLGVDNFWGALATDLALDPTTYFGAGIVKNFLKKGLKKGSKKLAPKLINKADDYSKLPDDVNILDLFKSNLDDLDNGVNKIDIDPAERKEMEDFLNVFKQDKAKRELGEGLESIYEKESRDFLEDQMKRDKYFDDVAGLEDEDIRFMIDRGDVPSDVIERLIESRRGNLTEDLIGNQQGRSSLLDEFLKRKDIPADVKSDMMDIDYLNIGNRREGIIDFLKKTGIDSNNFPTGGEPRSYAVGGEQQYVNGVYLPDEKDIDDKYLDKNINRAVEYYSGVDPTLGLAPLMPPPKTNIFLDTLQTGVSMFGDAKSAFSGYSERQEDWSNKLPSYYKYDVNTEGVFEPENQMKIKDWAQTQFDEWKAETDKNVASSNEEKASILGTTVDKMINGQTFEQYNRELGQTTVGKTPEEIATMQDLYRAAAKKARGGEQSLPKAQYNLPDWMFGKDGAEYDMGGSDFNPYTDSLQDMMENSGQTNYMEDLMNTIPPKKSSNAPTQPDEPVARTAADKFGDITLPEARVSNPLSGTLDAIADSPLYNAATAMSNFAVKGAGFLNRRFAERDFKRQYDKLELMGGADFAYDTKMSDPMSEGYYGLNDGRLQGEAERTTGYYMNFQGSPTQFGGATGTAKKGGEFKAHMMFDPKTGKAYEAKVPADHERMAKMGYLHKDEMQDGGSVTPEMTPEMKAYLEALAFNKEARQALGTNDTEKLKQLRLDKPYSNNDLARDFSELQQLRKAAGLGVMEEASILFPHVGQQIRGGLNEILGTNFEQGGEIEVDNDTLAALIAAGADIEIL